VVFAGRKAITMFEAVPVNGPVGLMFGLNWFALADAAMTRPMARAARAPWSRMRVLNVSLLCRVRRRPAMPALDSTTNRSETDRVRGYRSAGGDVATRGAVRSAFSRRS
jgi:hypothetical protein